MENTINAEIKRLEEKESNGILVDGSTIGAICQITKDLGDKVAVEYYTVARLGKSNGQWKLFNTDLSERIKSNVFPKDTVAKWQFFADQLFSEIPENFIERFNEYNQPDDIQAFREKVAYSDLDEQPICEAEYQEVK